jgi:GT2 family glycosyltransferase
MKEVDLSIVIPTCNRPEHLRQLLDRIHSDVKCSHEIVVVTGSNDDQTPRVLDDAQKIFGDRLKIIREPRREGFVRAANKGFRAATARNMIWLNDDCRHLHGTLDEAVHQIDAAPAEIAFLAMFHRYASTKNIAYQSEYEGQIYSLCHVRGTLYANFPIGRRQTYESLGFFDEQFYFYAADPDLSLKAWHAGLKVAPAHNCFIDHDEHQDDRRAQDTDRAKDDNVKLFAKWNLPEKNLERNDFNPETPNTLRGLRMSLPTSPGALSSPSPGTPGEGTGGGCGALRVNNAAPLLLCPSGDPPSLTVEGKRKRSGGGAGGASSRQLPQAWASYGVSSPPHALHLHSTFNRALIISQNVENAARQNSSEQIANRITFLIATHNRKTSILNTLSHLQALESSLDFPTQTIVIDNASTDGSPDAIASQFPNVILIRQKKNHGACAKNAGFPQATGDFILFLDDDSYPDPHSLGQMIHHFAANPRLGAATFTVTLPDGSHEASAFPSVCIGCGTAFRREALIAAGGLPTDFFMQAEEYHLSLRILDAGWDIHRFDDLNVTHLKTKTARHPTRTTRLDIRNNLLVIVRNFPRRWILPYAIDWMNRYRWLAASRGPDHLLTFYLGLAQGLLKSANIFRRRPVSDGAFEKFAMLNRIQAEMRRTAREQNLRNILLVDVGKNLYAYWRAARDLNLNIVAIADNNLAALNRTYRGIPIVTDATARTLTFDVAIQTNISPVHGPIRSAAWRATDSRPLINFFESPSNQNTAIAA